MIAVLSRLISTNSISQKLPSKLLVKRKSNTFSGNLQKMVPNQDIFSYIVWMDLEMTGLDVIKDKILEVACIITDKNLNVIAEGPCFAVNHPEHIFQQMNDWCMKNHYKSGLVDKCLKSKITTKVGEQLILDFLKEHIPERMCPLGGNSIYMDRLFLRQHMPAVDDYLHYRIIDVSTVKELAKRWNHNLFEMAPKKLLEHRSLEDIYESIAELKFYRQKFFKAMDETTSS